jgi:uncharacterized protein YidB (DUF937 family)
MARFEDAVREAVPGGNLAKPLLIAAAALLAAKFFGQSSSQDASAPGSVGSSSGSTGSVPGSIGSVPGPALPSDDNILAGLGPLVEKFQKGGLGEVINSWVGPGQNQPIQPGQLGSVLGDQTVNTIARQAGIKPDELLAELSKVLPGIIDKLTPQGRLPT